MTAKGRTVWKDKAAELEKELEQTKLELESWRKLASIWRGRFMDLNDQVALAEANASMHPVTVPADEGTDDVS